MRLDAIFPALLLALILPACGGETEADPLALQGEAVATVRALHVHLGPVDGAPGAIAGALSAQFARANGGKIRLDVAAGPVVAFPAEDAVHDYSASLRRHPHLLPAHVAPVWYYEEGSGQLREDLRDLLARLDLTAYEVVIVTTSAQIDGLGVYLAGLPRPTVIVESLALGGWSMGAPYAALPVSRAQLLDTSIHELGHFMGLAHACEKCNGDPSCCARCTARDDVMSYCRARPDDTSTRAVAMNVFTSCTRQQILTRFAPAYLAGQPTKESPACERQD
jgi:hypothetical protein